MNAITTSSTSSEMRIADEHAIEKQNLGLTKSNSFDWIPVTTTTIAVDYRGKYAGALVDEEKIESLPEYPRNTPTRKM